MKRMLHIAALLASFAAAAQTYITPVKSDLMPPTPQSAKPVEYQMPQPAMLTGAVDLSIPLYTIHAGNFSLPVYLQYHSNGIKVMDDPCPNGYGWGLMPALRATRTILGVPTNCSSSNNIIMVRTLQPMDSSAWSTLMQNPHCILNGTTATMT